MGATTDPKTTSPRDGFKPGLWQKEINVRDFIQQNYDPYDGDRVVPRPRDRPHEADPGAAERVVRRGAQEGRARRLPDSQFDHGSRPRLHRQGERDHRRPADRRAAQASDHAQWRLPDGPHFAQDLRLRARPACRRDLHQVPQDSQRRRLRRLHRRRAGLSQFAHPHRAARRLRPRADHRRLPPRAALRRRAVDRTQGRREARASTRRCRPRRSFATARS